MNNQASIAAAKEVFTRYLEEHGHRRTVERFSVLEEIYLLNDHFDVESLFMHMKGKGHRISRATLYNTIELLLDSELITRHQFGKNLEVTVAYVRSKRTDTQTAPYPIHEGDIVRTQVQWSF